MTLRTTYLKVEWDDHDGNRDIGWELYLPMHAEAVESVEVLSLTPQYRVRDSGGVHQQTRLVSSWVDSESPASDDSIDGGSVAPSHRVETKDGD
jgi:hypothetical protein